MQEWIKKSNVLEILKLPSDMIEEYIYEEKGIWIDENEDWISIKDRLPKDFVSVIGCMTDADNFPSVRECYLIGGNNEKFYFPALGEFHPISHWMEFPKEPNIN